MRQGLSDHDLYAILLLEQAGTFHQHVMRPAWSIDAQNLTLGFC